jgi:hypothetical protein
MSTMEPFGGRRARLKGLAPAVLDGQLSNFGVVAKVG